MAGVEGIEPPVRVLETRGLPLTDTPIRMSKFKRQKAKVVIMIITNSKVQINMVEGIVPPLQC